MKRIPFIGLAFVLLMATLSLTLSAAPAQAATVSCFGYVTASHKYPADAMTPTKDIGHYRRCIAHPTPQQAMDIARVAESLQGISVSGAGTVLQSKDATFFYFASRADYNSYMTAHFGSGYATSTARCGITHFQPPDQILESSVFDQCTFDNSTMHPHNGNPVEAITHEFGHAFSAAVGNIYGDKGPGRSIGFRQLVVDDENNLDAQWAAQPTPATKNNYICSIFGNNVFPSLLEQDLGTMATPVCPGGVNRYPITSKPSNILKNFLPYFFNMNPQFEEVWAEAMVIITGGPGGADLLPATNHVYSFLQCVRNPYLYYYQNGVPPAQNNAVYNGCVNPPTPSQFR